MLEIIHNFSEQVLCGESEETWCQTKYMQVMLVRVGERTNQTMLYLTIDVWFLFMNASKIWLNCLMWNKNKSVVEALSSEL